jgi:hypothetical protein
MATAPTRPFRILEADHAPIRLLAGVKQCSPAEVVHSALEEYFSNHREELSTVFTETQQAIEAGDVERLTSLLSEAAEQQRSTFEQKLAALR